MKLTSRVNVLLLTLVPSIAFVPAGSAADLSTVYQQALENDHELKAAVATYKANAERKNLGRSGLLPRLNAQASYTDSSSDSLGSRVGTSGFQNVDSSTDTTSTGYSINVSQALFDLSAWHDFKAGAATKDAAEAQLKVAEQALIIRVARAYFDALQAADNLETSLAEEKAFKHQLDQSQQRFEVGLSAITEVHESQAVYDSAVARRLNAQGQVGIAFEALEVLTGQSYFELAPIKSGFEASAPAPAKRLSWVNRALENNANLAAAKSDAKSAEQSAKAARSDHLPTVTLSGSYSDRNNDSFTSEFSNSDIDSQNQSIGVTLNVPLFAGGATAASSRRAKQQAISARENYLKSKRDVVQAARANYLSVITSVATVKALQQAIVSNQSALEATQAGYSVGTRDLVDVLNAQRGLYNAKRNYFDALYTYVINSLRLKETAGVLSSGDLDTLNGWLDTDNLVQKTSIDTFE